MGDIKFCCQEGEFSIDSLDDALLSGTNTRLFKRKKNLENLISKGIEPEHLVGKYVHFIGYNKGCVWILKRIEGDKAICITPKTRKNFIGSIYDMYPTKKYFQKMKV